MMKLNWLIRKTEIVTSKIKAYFAVILLSSLAIVATGSADLNIASDSAQIGSPSAEIITSSPSPSPTPVSIFTQSDSTALLTARNKLEDQPVSYEEEFVREKDASGKHLKNRLVVKFKDGVSDDDKRSIVHKVGGKFIREDMDLGGAKIIYTKREDAENLLSKDPMVEDVHKQDLLQMLGAFGAGGGIGCPIPNDPYYCNNWQWGLSQIGAPAGWQFNKGSSTVTVAVLDSGYDLHRDTDTTRLYLGKNYIDGSNDVSDDDGHGTNVASIIVAKTNNNLDIAAVNWYTKVLIGKVNNAAGEGTVQDLAAAINDIVNNSIYRIMNIKVINLSVASLNDVDRQELRDAIGNAYNHNILVVAAAKNERDFPEEDPATCFIGFPAAYWQVVSVVGVYLDNGTHSYRHSYGCYRTTLNGNTYSSVDISAPGSDVYTLGVLNDGTSTVIFRHGTSIAAPFVSGTAAAVAACIPNFTVEKLRAAVLNPARDIAPVGVDSEYGHGMLYYGGSVIYNNYQNSCPSY